MTGRTLVVGASGLVGGEATRLLARAGCAVRALVRSPARAETLPAQAEIALGDLADPASLDAALDGVDAVLLVSSQAPDQVALQGNLVAAARRAGAPHVVKISGFLTALDGPAASGRWHAETEAAIREAGLPWTFLRPPFFMQNLLRLRPHAVSGGEIALPVPSGRVAMVDARDVAAAAVGALGLAREHGRAHLVTGPEALGFEEVARRLSARLGRTVAFRPTSAHETRRALEEAGAPPWRVELVLAFYEGFESGDGAEVSESVRELTGREPRSFEDFVDDHLEALTASTA